jgi:hypothetical protein
LGSIIPYTKNDSLYTNTIFIKINNISNGG